MQETRGDLDRLQALLNHSAQRASAFLRSAFEIPQHSLSAAQLVAQLQGLVTVALATVTARGEPRVAPISAFFLHGSFYVPTVAEAARARHIARRPAVSLTYYQETEIAVLAHGHATLIKQDDPHFGELNDTHVGCGGQSVLGWHGEGVFLRIEADSIFTYARDPALVEPGLPAP